ncbi:hypothetical protein HDU93_003189, partial [Gonapodya sp. JEL0774]
TSFEACTGAAAEIDSIIRRVSEEEPTFAHLNPFAAYCIFESGMVHLVNAIVLDMAHVRGIPPSNAPFRNTAELATKAKASVRVHIAALEKLSCYWLVGDAYHVNLKKLAAENRVFESTENVATVPTDIEQLMSAFTSGAEMNLDFANVPVDLGGLDLEFLDGLTSGLQ